MSKQEQLSDIEKMFDDTDYSKPEISEDEIGKWLAWIHNARRAGSMDAETEIVAQKFVSYYVLRDCDSRARYKAMLGTKATTDEQLKNENFVYDDYEDYHYRLYPNSKGIHY